MARKELRFICDLREKADGTWVGDLSTSLGVSLGMWREGLSKGEARDRCYNAAAKHVMDTGGIGTIVLIDRNGNVMD